MTDWIKDAGGCKAVAQKLGAPLATVYAWSRGKTTPTRWQVRIYKRVLGSRL